MHKHLNRSSPIFVLLILMLVAGLNACAFPYSKSYRPLLDLTDERLIKADTIEHRWVEHMNQESVEMYRQGYAMIGYSYMIGAHIKSVAPAAAKNFGGSLDAAKVLQYNNRDLYLATYWRAVRGFNFGAYYEDAPASARKNIGGDVGVIIQDVVNDTPAHAVNLMPGDILLALDNQLIPNALWLDEALEAKSGQEIILTVWPMLGIEPVNIQFTLTDSSTP